jgi:hypothetical protein
MCDAARPDGSLYVPYLAIELRWIIGPLFSVKYIPLPTDVNWGSRVRQTMTGAVSKSMATIEALSRKVKLKK